MHARLIRLASREARRPRRSSVHGRPGARALGLRHRRLHERGQPGTGKKLFVQACGGCHTLADAGTNGNVGPNLDDAFAQAREAGMTSDTFTQVVATQIKFPIEHPSTGAPGMPAVDQTLPSCDDVEGDGFCVEDQDQAVGDVAVYVGSVAGTGVTAEKPTDGKSIFTANCGSCHTLADAGTVGERRAEPRRRKAAEGRWSSSA